MGDIGVPGVTCVSDDLRVMSAIAAWYEVIQGGAALKRALESLCDAFGAEAAAVSRFDRTRSTTRIIPHDAELRNVLAPKLSRSFAHSVLGDYAGKVRPATIWSSTMVTDPDPALTHFQERRALRELIVIPLGTIDTGEDYLELHYRESVDQKLQVRLQYLAETLCHAWRNRDPGLFVERMLASQRNAGGRTDYQDILAFGNPAKLSRAEYRVCLLLSRGLSNESVCEELSITASTLRSHLRAIYDKTGVESKAELIYHLLSSKTRTRDRRVAI
jgi:DNA-binding CsgD family transcriptional regulator